MERRVIEIDQEACNGCGLCVNACDEGAIGMINGKAHLLRDDYCDGLGNCLPSCPQDAIHFIIRQAAPFDEAAVKRRIRETQGHAQQSSAAKTTDASSKQPSESSKSVPEAKLSNWPIQLQLVSAVAPVFDNADILVAADCTAYAYGGFHDAFMDDRVTIIACPKLDNADYTRKLSDIFRDHEVRSILVTRIDLPCCSGIERAVKSAVELSGKEIPVDVVVIGSNGEIRQDTRKRMEHC